MYKVTVTADGTTVAASKHCLTKREAESVKQKLSQLLKMPVDIDIIQIGSSR